jgi:hypothetical protein
VTQRERNLAVVLGVMLGLAFFGGGGYWLYANLAEHNTVAESLRKQIAEADDKITAVEKAQQQLNHWRRLSLPDTSAKTREEYKESLKAMMRESDVMFESIPAASADSKSSVLHPTKPGKLPIYTGFNFNIRARAKLPALVAFLEKFQKTAVMHRIRVLTIEHSSAGTKKKDADFMTVTMGVEAISILDAADYHKKIGSYDRPLLGFDAAAPAPAGALTSLGWYLSPYGPKVQPLNPPVPSRNYADIPSKNPFTGGRTIEIQDPKSRPEGPPDPLWVNMMAYTRLVSMIDEDGRPEGKLWDYLWNKKHRIRKSLSFDRIPMVQTRDARIVIVGLVKDISMVDASITYRVSLNYRSADSNTKWWRYPADDYNFYRLHPSDLKILKNVKPEEKERIFVTSEMNWNYLVKKGKVNVSKDGKTFTSPAETTPGTIVYEGDGTVVVRVASWPPQSSPKDSYIAADRLYPDATTIYKVHPKHFDVLLERKLVKKDEEDRVYVMQQEYWTSLRDQRILSGGGQTFTFFKDLVRGDVVEMDPDVDVVVFRVAEKYCKFPGIYDPVYDKDGTTVKEYKTIATERWHEGYCLLHLGALLEESLQAPLSAEKLKEYLPSSAGN